MHGSPWPSHRGAIGFVKSFDHDSLLSMGSWTLSLLRADNGEVLFELTLFILAGVLALRGVLLVELGKLAAPS